MESQNKDVQGEVLQNRNNLDEDFHDIALSATTLQYSKGHVNDACDDDDKIEYDSCHKERIVESKIKSQKVEFEEYGEWIVMNRYYCDSNF